MNLRERRERCALVRRYPFRTKALSQCLQEINENHPLAGLLQSLKSYEKETLFQFGQPDRPTQYLRSLLEYEYPGLSAESLTVLNTANRQLMSEEETYGKLCSLLTVYRIIDVYTGHPAVEPNVNERTSFTENGVFPNSSRPDLAKTTIWPALQNWPGLLKRVTTHIKTITKLRTSKEISDNISRGVHVDHLFAIAQRNEIGKLIHLFDNFQTAAMHLSYLLNADGASSVMPDIPDDVQNLLQSTSSTDALNSPSVKQEVIANFLKDNNASMLRLPLQLALLISPLILLMMRPLTDLKIKRATLLKSSEDLGNQQPLELRELESDILGCVFRISKKPEHLFLELENLITSERWKSLENLQTSHPAFAFFNGVEDESVIASSSIASSSSHSCQLEKRVGNASPAVQAPVNLSNIFHSPNHHFSFPTQASHDSIVSAAIMGQNMSTGPSTEEAEQIGMTTNDDDGDNNVIGTTKPMDEDSQTPDNGESQGQVANKGKNKEGLMRIIVNPAVTKNPRTEAVSPNDGGAMEVETGGECPPDPRDAEDEQPNGQEDKEKNGDAMEVETGGECSPDPRDAEDEEDNGDEDKGEGLDDLVDDAQAQNKDDDRPDGQKGSDRQLRSLTGNPSSKQPPLSSSNNAAGSSKKRKRSTKSKSKIAPDYEDVEPEKEDEEEEEEEEVIDVDIFETRRVTLDITTQPDKLTPGPEITAYGPRGEIKTFKPCCYDKKSLKIIKDLSKAIEDAYENGKPLHISNPSKSIFRILSEKEAEAMSVDSIQEILRTQHIVLTDVHTGPRPTTFRQALQPLGAPSTVLTIQDYSIPVTTNYNKRKKQGKMVQLADASEQPNGKVLNALDIPMKMAGINSSPFSSDAHALTATGGRWMSSAPLSVGDFRWALAATAGAFHTWHIDSDGLSTFIQTIVGAKWWIMARPRGDVKNFTAFMNSGIFLDKCFDIDNPCTDIWDVEAMLLEPGTKLIMRPNTPHVVFTPDHSVVHGGHLYPRATLQDSLAGIIHCFVAGNWITNTNHTVARFHLQQMIVFCHMAIVEQDIWDDGGGHIPDPSTVDGFMDLLALCCYGILINALDFDTYLHPGQLGYTRTRAQDKEMIDHDTNNLSLKERQSCTYTRGQSLQILDCISHMYSLTYQSDSEKEDKGDLQLMRDMQCSSMTSMILEIYSYKSRAVKRVPKVEGVPGCTLDLLRLQLANAFPDQHPVYDALSKCQWLDTNEPKPLNLDMGIESLKKSHHSSAFIRRDPANIGMNNRDARYYAWMDVAALKSEDRASVPPRKRTKVE